jgi:hypothetical protein
MAQGVKADTLWPVSDQVQLDMVMRNNSLKTITGLAWIAEGRYADGSLRTHHLTVDVISDLQLDLDTFRPGWSPGSSMMCCLSDPITADRFL